jgi:hypothetical protein
MSGRNREAGQQQGEGDVGKPAIWLNKKVMQDYRPRMKPMYYDSSKYDTYTAAHRYGDIT